MPSRPLVALEAPQASDDVLALRRLLDSALMGNGPALVVMDSSTDAGGRLRRFVTEVRPRVEGSTSLVVPTSGSTGRPRLVKLSASALLAGARCTHQVLGGPGRWLLALPLSHIAGLQVLVRSLAAGREPVVVEPVKGFRPDIFASAVARLPDDGPTYTAVVPTQLNRLLDADPEPLRRFDAVLVGGAAAAPSLIERARDLGVRIVVTYGMTETCGGVVYDGVPLPGTEAELDTWGRIRLRGPTVFSGYLSWADQAEPATLRHDTWFTTADLGRFHDDGRLEVIGRTDDVVITGGVNVAPAAVEAALADHPAVAQVCVIGRPDARWGEAVTAIVQPRDFAEAPSLESLRQFARSRLPPQALPLALIEVVAIPLLPSGKPDRVALRALLGDAPTSAPE